MSAAFDRYRERILPLFAQIAAEAQSPDLTTRQTEEIAFYILAGGFGAAVGLLRIDPTDRLRMQSLADIVIANLDGSLAGGLPS